MKPSFYMHAEMKNMKRWWSSNRWKVALLLWGAGMAAAVLLLLCRGCGDNEAAHKTMSPARVTGLQEVIASAHLSNERIAYSGFIVNFNASLHLPNSVSYTLTRERMQGTAERSDHFEADPTVAGCAQPDDYVLSGYERGHMAPAHDMAWSEDAMRESFLMTNVCPQDKRLNQGGWAKLEEKVREWTVRDSVLVVVTGPVPDTDMERLPTSGVAVPRRFYKVIIAPCARPVRCAAFVYPNGSSGGKLKDYAVTVDDVERLTGLDFFSSLPDDIENQAEARCNLLQWTNR